MESGSKGRKNRVGMPGEGKPWFCYMVRCRDAALYVGVATDVRERVKEHNWGVGARFTEKRRPVELVWWQEFPDQKGARRREKELKGWRREKKLRLIEASRLGANPSPARDAGSG